ncbi:DUF5658 family protein [Romboutsia sp.]|uniref:DUF5658 family protein n=1 Tax=Romboutsia sp. TaxID=1965302 RepID=UPI003F3F7867
MRSEVIKGEKNYILMPLIFLNLFDGIATYIGLNLGVYIELNKMLNWIYKSNSFVFIFVKIILPTLIFLLLSIKLKENISIITKIFVYTASTIYFALCIYHITLFLSIIT